MQVVSAQKAMTLITRSAMIADVIHCTGLILRARTRTPFERCQL